MRRPKTVQGLPLAREIQSLASTSKHTQVLFGASIKQPVIQFQALNGRTVGVRLVMMISSGIYCIQLNFSYYLLTALFGMNVWLFGKTNAPQAWLGERERQRGRFQAAGSVPEKLHLAASNVVPDVSLEQTGVQNTSFQKLKSELPAQQVHSCKPLACQFALTS